MERRKVGRVVAIVGGVCVVVGFGTCFVSMIRAVTTFGDAPGGDTPNVFVPFVIGMGIAAVGGFASVIGAALASKTEGHDDDYETLTRPRQGEVFARHGDSVHELVDD